MAKSKKNTGLKKSISIEMQKAVKNLKNRLPDGAIKKIAETVGKSTGHVSRVLNCKLYPDPIIIKAGMDLALEEKEREEMLISELNQLN